MQRNEHADTLVIAAEPSPRGSGPRWRALLEARWRERLQEVTELSLAYHAAAGSGTGSGDRQDRRERPLLRRAVSARRKLADTEEALSRLSAGRFGSCEECGTQIPSGLLAAVPEARYCQRCDDGILPA